MRDREMVAAIVAGDPAGLGAAYDRYAEHLYLYCLSMLGEPADAADAVQDTFIIAAEKLSALRDPDRLRPWLYAVARNECHRRLRARATAAPLDEAAEVSDGAGDVGTAVEQEQLHELMWAALGGLTPSEREIIELTLGHELAGEDLADALGVPRNQAHAMASRARDHYETALSVLLVARTGIPACPELAEILADWDGQLTVLLRKRLGRHIRRCATCNARQRREMSPITLLGLLPAAMLPAGLRHQVLGLVADGSPAAVARRVAIGQQAGSLGPGGFPQPISPPPPVGLIHRYARTGTAVAGSAAIIGGALIVGGLLHHHHAPHPAPGAHSVIPSVSVSTAVASAPSSGRAGAPSAGSTAAPGTVQPAIAPQALVSPASVPSATASSGPAGGPSPASPAASSSRPGVQVSAGTLVVAPAGLTLGVSLGASWSGTLTLTAQGGPVAAYHVSVAAPNLQDLVFSRTSGSLAAGQSVQIKVTAPGAGLFSTAIVTVDPGGLAVYVSYHLAL